MKRWQHRVWKCTAGVFSAGVILLATAVGLFRLLAPLVPGYRAQVETYASRVLGKPVSIAAMGAQWDWYGPELTLEQVRILSPDRQRVVTEAREIRLGITLRALWHGQFSRPNRITLIQPQFVLERDTDGSYGVRGLEGSLKLNREKTDWHQAAVESFAQDAEVIIRQGKVTLIDMRTPTLPLVFGDIRLKFDNSAESHDLSGRLTLPTALGHDLSFASRIQGQGVKPEAWQWHTSVEGAALNLPRLLTYWPAYNGRFTSGLVDLRAQAQGQGAVVNSVTVNVDGHDVFLPGTAAVVNGFNAVNGSVEWSRSENGWRLSGSDLRLQRGTDIWPNSHFILQYAQVPNGGEQWSGETNFLRLQDCVTLARWMPADLSAITTRLLRLSPRGDVTDAAFAFQRDGKSLGSWQVRGRFTGLGMRADGDLPGFTGLDGELALDQDGGTLKLATHDSSVNFPRLFRGPLYATALNADVRFRRDPLGWHIATDDFSVANADAKAQAKGSIALPADGSSPLIDLDASVTNADARNKSAYFPVGIMPKEVVAWLDSAITAGQVPAGSLSLHGELKDFPYDHGGGVFDIRFHLVRGGLDYAAGWPKAQDLDADVEFKNAGMDVTVNGGTVLGDDIKGVTARFADLSKGILEINGTARGDAQATLDFLRTDPIKERFGHYLDRLKVSGRSDVTLHLVLPVEQVEKFRLQGKAALGNVNVELDGLPQWRLSNLNGTLAFGTEGVSARKLQAVLLGAPLSISLHPGNGADAEVTVFNAVGIANAGALATALNLPVKDALSGGAVWQLGGRIPDNPARSTTGLSLALTSNLQGFAINLPAPFGKPADVSRPLSATLKLVDDTHMESRISYGPDVQGVFGFAADGNHWGFARGDLHFGAGMPVLPESAGLSINGTLPELSLDEWQRFTVGGSGTRSLPPQLHNVDLSIEQFTGFSQSLKQLHVNLMHGPQAWLLKLASATITGQITWPYNIDAKHPIIADMDQMTLTRDMHSIKDSPAARLDPRDVPALEFTSRKFRYGDIALDAVHAELMPQAGGVALRSLSAGGTAFSVTGNGQWAKQADGKQNCALVLQLTSKDVGRTLQAFGYQAGITGAKGELQSDLNWQGGPFGDVLQALGGKIHIKLRDGQLLEVQPGAGRIFGLLSLNALPRRLLLNFSDVFGKGFAYDSIEGNFTLERGNAYTSDLTVAGPAARIQVIGRIGLAKHDFDEALLVVPSVGSTLPVLGALAASSVGVGAVIFLLTEIFKKPISEAGEIRYRLTGTWDNPLLEKVAERKPAPVAAQH